MTLGRKILTGANPATKPAVRKPVDYARCGAAPSASRAQDRKMGSGPQVHCKLRMSSMKNHPRGRGFERWYRAGPPTRLMEQSCCLSCVLVERIPRGWAWRAHTAPAIWFTDSNARSLK